LSALGIHRVLDQQCRSIRQQHPAMNFGQLMHETDGPRDPVQASVAFQRVDKAAQIMRQRQGRLGKGIAGHAGTLGTLPVLSLR
jgi:hypothetical protein